MQNPRPTNILTGKWGDAFTGGDATIVRYEKNCLPKVQRDLLQMRFWEGLSTLEISVIRSLPWDIVYSELQAAMTTLKGRCLAYCCFSRNAAPS